MCDRPGLDLSFSGLKTAVRQLVESLAAKGLLAQEMANVCASFQAAVVDTLNRKIKRAMKQTQCKALVVAGGVSANLHLREVLDAASGALGTSHHKKQTWRVIYPRLSWCTDNGVMVAYAGVHAYQSGLFSQEHLIAPLGVKARWPLSELVT